MPDARLDTRYQMPDKVWRMPYTRPVHAGDIESIRSQSIIKLVNFNQSNFNSNFLEVKFNQSI